MAERVTRKSKRSAPPRRRGAGTPPAAAEKARNAQRLEALERERDQLKAKLSEALARVAALEKARNDAVDRIDWAIDSLHNVLESEA